MPYRWNIILAAVLFACGLFTGYKLTGYITLVLATPASVIESGHDLIQVKQVYALGRVTLFLVACSFIVYFGHFPQVITLITGVYFLRGALELLLSTKGDGIYAASMLIFYEAVLPEQESNSEGQAFRTLARGAAVLNQKHDSINDSLNSLIDRPTAVMMRAYAAHCNRQIRRRAAAGKASAALWSLVMFVAAWYLWGF